MSRPGAVSTYVMPTTRGQLSAMFARLPDDRYVVLTRLRGGRVESETFTPDVLDAAGVRAAQWADAGDNVYLRTAALCVRPEPGKRGGADDTGALVCLWGDLDFADPGHAEPADGLPLPPSIEHAELLVDDLGLPPSFILHTGGGLQPFWLLAEPLTIDTPEQLEHARLLARRWGDGLVELGRRRGWHVDYVGDLARVLRVAGTWRRKPGCPPHRVTLSAGIYPDDGVAFDDRWRPGPVYTVADLEAAIVEPVEPERPLAPRRPARTTARQGDDYGPADAISELLTWADILEPHGWTYVGSSTVAGELVELWRRPGDPTSPYSLKAWPDGPAICWSSSAGLPAGPGERLNKWRVWCSLNYGGDESTAARDVRRWARKVGNR